MEEKSKAVSFYSMYKGKSEFDLKAGFDNLFNSFSKGIYPKYSEITDNDGTCYYVSVINSITISNNILYDGYNTEWYVYAINIARVDTNKEIKYGNLKEPISKREGKVDLSDEEIDMSEVGPLIDTQLIIDPFYNVIATSRTNGGANIRIIKLMIQSILKCRGIRISPILDVKNLKDIKNLSVLKSLEFTLLNPVNNDVSNDNSRSEIDDIKFAENMGATKLKLKIEAPNFNNNKIFNKVKNLLNSDQGEANAIKVEGIDNGNEVIFDLVKNKLEFKGKIKFDKDKGITIRNCFDYLGIAYINKSDYISKNLKVVEIEKDSIKDDKEK